MRPIGGYWGFLGLIGLLGRLGSPSRGSHGLDDNQPRVRGRRAEVENFSLGPRDHVNIRISPSGSKAQYSGDTGNTAL